VFFARCNYGFLGHSSAGGGDKLARTGSPPGTSRKSSAVHVVVCARIRKMYDCPASGTKPASASQVAAPGVVGRVCASRTRTHAASPGAKPIARNCVEGISRRAPQNPACPTCTLLKSPITARRVGAVCAWVPVTVHAAHATTVRNFDFMILSLIATRALYISPHRVSHPYFRKLSSYFHFFDYAHVFI
jgi:hypothetical protein